MLINLNKNPIRKPGYKKITLEYSGQKIPAYYYPSGIYVYFKFSYPEPENVQWKKQRKEDTGELFQGKKLKKK